MHTDVCVVLCIVCLRTHTQAGGLHSWGRVDSISKQTVSWHLVAYYSCHTWTCAAKSSKLINMPVSLSTYDASYSKPLSPVWMPALSCSLWLGMWGMETCLTAATRSRDILAISSACLSPFLSGRPLTTMYASPIVSTWFDSLTTLCSKTESSWEDTWTSQGRTLMIAYHNM